MTTVTSVQPSSPNVEPNVIARAYEELNKFGLAPAISAIEQAQQLNALICGHIQRARQHTLALGPIMIIIRDQQMYTHLGFNTFGEWLSQPEIDMNQSTVTEIINIWKIAIPALEAAGISPSELIDEVSFSKARLLLKPLRQAYESGVPLSKEDTQDLMNMAKLMPYEDLQRHLKPSGTHMPKDNDEFVIPEDEEEPYIKFKVKKFKDLYKVSATFTEKEMEWIDRKLRPVWVDEMGDLLQVTK